MRYLMAVCKQEPYLVSYNTTTGGQENLDFTQISFTNNQNEWWVTLYCSSRDRERKTRESEVEREERETERGSIRRKSKTESWREGG